MRNVILTTNERRKEVSCGVARRLGLRPDKCRADFLRRLSGDMTVCNARRRVSPRSCWQAASAEDIIQVQNTFALRFNLPSEISKSTALRQLNCWVTYMCFEVDLCVELCRVERVSSLPSLFVCRLFCRLNESLTVYSTASKWGMHNAPLMRAWRQWLQNLQYMRLQDERTRILCYFIWHNAKW